MRPLAEAVGGDPYRRETVMARAHMDALIPILGLERKKCVVVDLDGVLWPGVLAETGSPFAWRPEISGPNSYVGLYFGIHEALRALRQRGILLACVSKNDDATVRALWRYQQEDPRHRLLLPEHFVCARINWQDKAENIRSIAEELGFPLDAFVFVDDTARERERVRESLPGVTVLGENLFGLRQILLTDPRLQPVHVTEEASRRSTLVKAQLDRTRLRAEIPDEKEFVATLQIESRVDRLALDDVSLLDRVRELFARTTQFNATGRCFTDPELRDIISREDGRVFTLRMRDRLGDHGLVGAAVVVDAEILNFVMSCRVIGLGGERTLLGSIAADPGTGARKLVCRIVPTDRNLPVRHLYSANGFVACGQDAWARTVAESGPATADRCEAEVVA
jgi:FkbH-like protein